MYAGDLALRGLATPFVCRAWGTVHEYQEPLREADQPRLLTQRGPLTLQRRPERPAFLDRRLHWEELVPPPGQGRREPEFQAAACSHCGAEVADRLLGAGGQVLPAVPHGQAGRGGRLGHLRSGSVEVPTHKRGPCDPSG
jgi:hypothetical protein